MTVLYLAAHGFAETGVPLGGGAAVCRELLREWTRTNPFPLKLITPAILGPNAPKARDLAAFTERTYARFCRRFEAATTAEVLKHDRPPRESWSTTSPKGPTSAASRPSDSRSSPSITWTW